VRTEPNLRIEQFRRAHPVLGAGETGRNFGYFERGPLRIVSSGTPDEEPEEAQWEHVSVSCAGRCPTWDEMQTVKTMFWRDDETVVQFHPRNDEYVNLHPYCLHLWRKVGKEFELPPRNLIG